MRDGGNDTSEVRSPETSEQETMDSSFSDELDDNYSKCLESDSRDFRERDDGEKDSLKKTDKAEDDLDTELEKKYRSCVEDGEDPDGNAEKGGLSETEKKSLKEENGWSNEIVDTIGSVEEAKIYQDANLKEEEIGGRKCLVRRDLDLEQKDEFGRTNRQRMENGNCPLTKGGGYVELHHIGQKDDSPLAELTTQEHRGKGNDAVLHDKTKESEIDRGSFATTRKQHWEERAAWS